VRHQEEKTRVKACPKLGQRIRKETRNLQMSEYADIQVAVLSQPFFQSTISSTRSCSQNTGPTMVINRLKLVDMIGNESGSFDDINVCRVESSFLLGLSIVGADAEVGVVGGRDAESSS